MKENLEIYFELFRDVERAIKLLAEAQRKAEDMFLDISENQKQISE